MGRVYSRAFEVIEMGSEPGHCTVRNNPVAGCLEIKARYIETFVKQGISVHNDIRPVFEASDIDLRNATVQHRGELFIEIRAEKNASNYRHGNLWYGRRYPRDQGQAMDQFTVKRPGKGGAEHDTTYFTRPRVQKFKPDEAGE